MPHPMLLRDQPYVPDATRQSDHRVSFKREQMYIGLDLGQLTDFSCASAIRVSLIMDQVIHPDNTIIEIPRRTPRGRLMRRFDVIGIRRYPLSTPYTSIVSHTRDQLRRLPGSVLVVDASGVGRGIVDMFIDLCVPVEAMTITGGQSWSNPKFGEWHVSKIELIACVRYLLETELLKVASGIEHRDILREELTNFRVRVTKNQNEIYAAREGENDDCVLSVALPIFLVYAMDQNQTFITGVDKVNVSPPVNPMRITADSGRLFGRKSLLAPDSGRHGSSSMNEKEF